MRAIERAVGLAVAFVWLGFMVRMLARENPELEAKARFYAERTVRVVHWQTVLPHLPTWAQEAAQVRGLAPVKQVPADLSIYQP
jgi:hypothetical protein